MAPIVDEGLPFGPASLVAVRSGIPVVVEQHETMVGRLPSGENGTETLDSKIYRDRSGRIRQETTPLGASGPVWISILDSTGHSLTIINPRTKQAERVSGSHFGPVIPGALIGAQDDEPVLEWLDQKVVRGIVFSGIRTSVSSVFKHSGPGSSERWESSELGLTAEVTTTTSAWTYVARIVNLERAEPEPSLFSIPAGYAIQESARSGGKIP